MVKIQEISESQKVVTIPIELAKAMGWEKGDEVSWSVEDSESLKLEKN
ncbi:MAG: AbrB/MazE/SpoVT family DNA-binding domain-containing protein [Candidatus Nanohaloarchaea archaeon]